MEQNCRIGRVLKSNGTELKKDRLLYVLVEYSKLYGQCPTRKRYYKISTLKTIIRFHK